MMNRYALSFMFLFLFVPVHGHADTTPEVLTLGEAQRIALENNEKLQVSRNNINIAEHSITEARSQLLPELRVSGESYRQKDIRQFSSPVPDHETNFSATLTQPIYKGGKNIHALEIRKQRKTISELTLFRRKQQILFDVTRIYYEVLLQERNTEIQRNTLRRAEEQLKLAESRYEVGKVTQNAVLRAQVQVSEARKSLTRIKNSARVAREDLAVELGMDSVSDTIVDTKSSPLTDTSMEHFQEIAYDHRRDLMREKKRIQTLGERVKVERGDYYPSFDLVSQYDWFDDEQFHGTGQDWRVTVQGSYSLFSGWRDESQTKRARKRVDSARQQYDRLKREIRRDVRRVYLDIQTQLDVIETLKSRVEQAQKNHREITARFEEGLVDAVDVSDAITILNEAELRLASAMNTLHLDRSRLKLATGEFAENILQQPEYSYE